jgi:hypothetical protein
VPPEIVFPNAEPWYVFERDCLGFRAVVDGKGVECLVSLELLMSRFGAREPTEESLRAAYRERRDELRQIARSHIENGWIDEEGRVLLTTRYTRLQVSFSDRLRENKEGMQVAEAAQRRLAEIIGPNAEEVHVAWDGSSPPGGHLTINFHLGDPSVPFSLQVFLDQYNWRNPTAFQLTLAGAWGSVLRARSRKLILQSG